STQTCRRPLAPRPVRQTSPLLTPGPFFGSTRAASILPSRPPNLAAAARRACQGWPRLRGHPQGLGLDWPERGGMLIGSGLQALATSGKFKPVALGQIRTAGNKRPGQGLQNVGDVLGAEGLECEPVRDGAGHRIGGVDLGQRQDLADVVAGVEPALLQAVVIGCRIRRQRQEAHHQTLFAGSAALGDQTLGVVWILDVLVTTIAALVTGDELVVEVDADP